MPEIKYKSMFLTFISSSIIPVVIMLILFLIGIYGQYLLFHFFAEFFAVFVALSLGVIVYYTYPFTRNHYLQFIGLGYFSVAFLDLLHVLTFPGMPFIASQALNTTLSIWIFTRLFEASVLFAAVFLFEHKLKGSVIIALCSLTVMIITVVSIFRPLSLYSSVDGLSLLKTELEYMVMLILGATLFVNYRKKKYFNDSLYWKIQAAVLLTIFSEFCFTLYTDIDGFFNLIGHLSKFLSFWFIFTAVVKGGLEKPLEMMKKGVSSYNAIPIPVIILSADGKIVQINRAAEHFIGIPASAVVGKGNHNFLHPAYLEEDECPVCLAVKGHRSLTNMVVSDKVKGRSIRYSLSPVGENQSLGMIQVSRDITEELANNDKLSSQNAVLNSVLNGTPDLIFYKDYLNADGRYLGCNKAFEQFIGKPKKEIVGRTDIEILGEELGAFFQAKDKSVLTKKRNVINDEWVTYPDGQRVLLSTSKSPLYKNADHILGVLGISRDISQYMRLKSEVQEQKETLEYQASYDQLTSLPNRTLLLDRIEQTIKLSLRAKNSLAILLIDLDHFKEINDSLGHQIGDQVIKKVAERLTDNVRSTDTVARLGGDEFAIVLSELYNTEMVIDIVDKLQKTMLQAICISGQSLYSTLSIGIAVYPQDGKNADELLKNADAAMYKAKDEGRNTSRFYTEEMTEKAFERIVMESSLRSAVSKEEFIVYYQPQVDAKSGKLVGMEALIRWMHPVMGMVSPAKFMTLAEETGLIIKLDQWTMRKAMRQLVTWYEMGLNPGVLALNLAMKQLQQDDFIEMLSNMLKDTNCKPEWLALEVTEGQIMINPENAILILKQISAMGIELAIDDFGTGYSSLSYLKHLPINKLKIDQSFVRGLPENEDDAAITMSVISLAKNLHLDVIAEGVETIKQVNFLADNGCFNIQGYYYGKPMPAQDMTDYLKTQNK
ncbi:bifunctional diguanylate cyclase/phosphodiesterase [Psychromonas ossibalaenae]|uniref:bifunctional diguanylate cyclase/phosphodiesterase n=1 Tax=Psychromonas ossibalaenae TaxID=444922 RepID=UPI000378179B|nr:EAL domain-containing protein [Psychromonas ossibalaenae]